MGANTALSLLCQTWFFLTKQGNLNDSLQGLLPHLGSSSSSNFTGRGRKQYRTNIRGCKLVDFSYKLLGTREWFVIHHTDCGMPLFTDEIIRSLLSKSLKTAVLDENRWRDVGEGPGSTEGDYIDWLTIKNLEQSVYDDVKRIRNHPLVPSEIPIYGYIYDVKTGNLLEVPEATELGNTSSV